MAGELTDLREVDLDILIDFAKQYSKLGWAVQPQLDTVIAGSDEHVNPNAFDEMKMHLSGFNNELDAVFLAYEDANRGDDHGHDHGEDDGDIDDLDQILES